MLADLLLYLYKNQIVVIHMMNRIQKIGKIKMSVQKSCIPQLPFHQRSNEITKNKVKQLMYLDLLITLLSVQKRRMICKAF